MGSLSHSLSALLAAIVTFAIGVSVALRDRRQRTYNHFALLCFTLCLWHFASFLQATTSSRPRLADAMYLSSVMAAVCLPIVSLRFFRSFLLDDPARKKSPPAPRILYLITLGFVAAIGYSTLFPKTRIQYARAFEIAVVIYVFLGLCASMYEIYAAWRRTLSRIEKTRLIYLLVGGIASIILAACDLLPRAGIPFPSLGNVLVTIYMFFLSQTLFRYRLLDLNEVLGRMFVLSAFVLILAAIYILLVGWIPSDQPGLLFFNTVIASFVIVILFEPLRAQIEGQINKWMFREKYELRRRVDGLRFQLANIIDVRDAIRVVIESLEESHRATHAAVYLVDQEGGGYELSGHLGPRPAERVDAAARRPFFERLTSQKGGVALSLEQLEREQAGRLPDDPATETLDAIARALDEVHAGVCIPILADEQLLGLLCLKDERLREAYATDEIDLFRALAAQLAITLQNSKLYERMKERDRLAALGEMAAGLAHEIRNPLGAIKGAAQYLSPPPPRLAGDGEARLGAGGEGETPNGSDGKAPAPGSAEPAQRSADAQPFLEIIVEEVNRLNKVVSQFLDYARPYRGELSPCDLNEVVRRSSQLFAPGENVELQLALDESAPRVRADAEQLRQVFLNLALNAVQAMPGGGKLIISTAIRKGGKRGAPVQSVEVRFRDTGSGISPTEMKNLFIPFFTTKDKGTGLGLPISQRIIENHGGAIEVRSRPGNGSTFTVVLPADKEEGDGAITITGSFRHRA